MTCNIRVTALFNNEAGNTTWCSHSTENKLFVVVVWNNLLRVKCINLLETFKEKDISG